MSTTAEPTPVEATEPQPVEAPEAAAPAPAPAEPELSGYAAKHAYNLEKHAAFPDGHPHQSEADAGKVSSTSLNEYVTVFTTRHADPLTVSFEVYCSGLTAVKLTVIYDGTSNFEPHVAEGGEDVDNKFIITVRPFKRTFIGFLQLIDPYQRASLKLKFEWEYEPASEEEFSDYFAWSHGELAKEVAASNAIDFPKTIEDPTLARVGELCRQHNVKFCDPEFSPSVSSLDCCDDVTENEDLKKIEWKRPSGFCKGKVAVFEGSIAAADIKQGALGDCWYLSALAALTEFPKLVRDIFIDSSEFYNDFGAYSLQFYKHGLENVVRIDDYFPTNAGPYAGPKYSRSNGNELWVLLAEKAYAKLHGSYSAIEAGWTAEALIDLTGAPSKTYRLDDAQVIPRIEDGSLWEELKYNDSQKFIMTATTPGEDPAAHSEEKALENETGLVPGHAYTLVSAVEVEGIKLVRLRNPWGTLEWTGDWSDSSPLWTPEITAALEAALDKNEVNETDVENVAANEKKDDGLFWMSFEDVVKHFNSVSVCYVRSKHYSSTPWIVERRSFFFDFDTIKTKDAAPVYKVRNPLYKLNVETEGEFCFSVHQTDARSEGSKPYIDIGVAVVQVDPERAGKYTLVAGTGITADRQNQTDLLKLAPGEYLVVPITSGSKLRQALEETPKSEEEERPPLTEVDANNVLHFSKEVHNAFRHIFKSLDADCDGFLKKTEFDQYMKRTEGTGVSNAAFQFLLDKFEKSEEKIGLSQRAFIAAQLHFFEQGGKNEARLLKELKSVGFDETLAFSSGRSAAVSVHGTTPYTFTGLPFNENCLTEAQEMVVAANGTANTFDEDRISIIVYRAGYFGASFMVENKGTAPLVFTLDMSASENVVSHRGNLVHTDLVPPGEKVVFHHIAPRDMDATWSWSYSANYMWDQRQAGETTGAAAEGEEAAPAEGEVAEEAAPAEGEVAEEAAPAEGEVAEEAAPAEEEAVTN